MLFVTPLKSGTAALIKGPLLCSELSVSSDKHSTEVDVFFLIASLLLCTVRAVMMHIYCSEARSDCA